MKICPSAKTVYIFLCWKLAVSSWVYEIPYWNYQKRRFSLPHNLKFEVKSSVYLHANLCCHPPCFTHIDHSSVQSSYPEFNFHPCLQCSPNQLHLWTKIASLWSLLMKIIYLHYGKSFTFDPSSLTSPSYMYQKERMSFIWPYSAWPYNVDLTRNKIPLLQNTIIDILQCI